MCRDMPQWYHCGCGTTCITEKGAYFDYGQNGTFPAHGKLPLSFAQGNVGSEARHGTVPGFLYSMDGHPACRNKLCCGYVRSAYSDDGTKIFKLCYILS